MNRPHPWSALVAAILLLLPFTAHAQSPAVADSIKAFTERATQAIQSGNFRLAAALGKEMIQLGRHDSLVFYSTGVALLLAGKKDDAVQFLDEAAARGWSDAQAWESPIFTPLNNDARFQTALQQVRQNARRAGLATLKDDGNARLREIWQADQKERFAMIGNDNPSRETLMTLRRDDSLRRIEIYGMLKAKALHIGTDFERAALILQHGDDTADYRTAHELALEAIVLGDTNAKWLAAATLDRYLMRLGKPQKYGTQFRTNIMTGAVELYPVDPSTTDEERARWHVPALGTGHE
jgi:hypothetical protein